MKIFLDAHVLVSVLNKEYPLFPYSSRLLSLADGGKFSVYTSPLCLAVAFYFAQKKHGSEIAKKKIALLSEKLQLSVPDEKTVMDVNSNKNIHDFEDGLLYYSAIQKECKCIITEDLEDFYFSKVEVMGCKAFLERYVLI